MLFRSTRGASPDVDLRTALLQGLAPDGGLYLPAVLAPLPAGTIARFRDSELHDIATAVLTPFCESTRARDGLATVVRDTFDFPIPLVQVDERVFVLELFHGPTLAFKDVGARFLARMLSVTRASEEPLVVLTATSGDTGGAVAHAFHDVPGTEAVVLFPEGRVSELQERQITTVGGNVRAVAVQGSFDDCQRLVKAVFEDADLRGRVALTSANSINVGRLLPQIVYYFAALAQLPEQNAPVVVSVPSGNLGNLTAGLMAKRLGLPVEYFVAATNANAVLGTYLETGRLDPQPSIRTVASAMDVGNPSNLERIISLYGGDREALRTDVRACAFSDDATKARITDVARRFGYVLDPHTAVGMCGLEASVQEASECTGIVLSTAHPAKFPEVVASAIGRRTQVPERLAAVRRGAAHSTTIAASLTALRRLLLKVPTP